MIENRFFDVRNLCEYIYLSKSTVYKMVSNNSIPHIKIGSRTLFDKVQIDKWILSGGIIEDELPHLPTL